MGVVCVAALGHARDFLLVLGIAWVGLLGDRDRVLFLPGGDSAVAGPPLAGVQEPGSHGLARDRGGAELLGDQAGEHPRAPNAVPLYLTVGRLEPREGPEVTGHMERTGRRPQASCCSTSHMWQSVRNMEDSTPARHRWALPNGSTQTHSWFLSGSDPKEQGLPPPQMAARG